MPAGRGSLKMALLPYMHLLHTLCALPAPSGQEANLTRFLLDYVREHGAG